MNHPLQVRTRGCYSGLCHKLIVVRSVMGNPSKSPLLLYVLRARSDPSPGSQSEMTMAPINITALVPGKWALLTRRNRLRRLDDQRGELEQPQTLRLKLHGRRQTAAERQTADR